MSGKDHDPPLTERGKNIAEPDPFFRIKTSRRLIKDQDLRVIQHSLSNAHTLEHPSGKLLHLFVRRISKSNHIKQFFDPVVCLLSWHFLQTGQIAQVLHRRVIFIVAKLLRQVAQQIPVGSAHGPYILPVIKNFPGCWHEQGRDHLDQGRFPCSIGRKHPVQAVFHTACNILNRSIFPIFLTDIRKCKHILSHPFLYNE